MQDAHYEQLTGGRRAARRALSALHTYAFHYNRLQLIGRDTQITIISTVRERRIVTSIKLCAGRSLRGHAPAHALLAALLTPHTPPHDTRAATLLLTKTICSQSHHAECYLIIIPKNTTRFRFR